jgi:hypothetical protein
MTTLTSHFSLSNFFPPSLDRLRMDSSVWVPKSVHPNRKNCSKKTQNSSRIYTAFGYAFLSVPFLLGLNLFDFKTFSWMNPLMTKGAAQFITEDDLPPLKASDESANLGKDLQRAMQKQYVPSLKLSCCVLIWRVVHFGKLFSLHTVAPLQSLPVSRSLKIFSRSCNLSCSAGF